MNGILVFLSLLQRAKAVNDALQGVAELYANAAAQGREVTMDEIKQYQLANEEARNILVEAINEAEEQG